MVKKIAVINDLSGFGKCSLTAAIPVISAMGVQPCPLPTAILTAQTGYPSYYCDDFTDKMEIFRMEWEKMGVSFDGICTGFLSDSGQAKHIVRFLDTFYREQTFLLVDPVMGDDGAKYPVYTSSLLESMKELVSRADVITPNLTELCLLTGTDYRLVEEISEKDTLLKMVSEMAAAVRKRSTGEVVVTGIRYVDPGTGEPRMGNLSVTERGTSFSSFPFLGESYSGTGDLFASVIAGGKARGDSLESSIELAGKMISLAIQDAVADGVPRNDGVNFEKYISLLIPGRKVP